MTESKHIVVLCTVPNEEAGKNIAETLLESRLAACVNIMRGLQSIYRWKGKIENDTELLLIIKSIKSKYGSLEAKIQEIHPYEVPEIISFDVAEGSIDYLNWITENVE